MSRIRIPIHEAIVLEVDMIDDEETGDSRWKAATYAACLFGKGTDLTNLSNNDQGSIAAPKKDKIERHSTQRIDKD